ncbi:ABC transporter permease [Wansuia hejianensis]|uniref:ABC transporter permease n=1 Tax=Wansuia hejianensis TaxID=2763667 RepID=A0A926IMU7_9FIRM|nr:ABC transporter permease [Wansuia hejianensis]MBC8590023.1 ABC transporter permease [Wansuia hejianensis]
MNRFITLIKGELLRLKRYNLFAASVFVSIMWVGILHFIDIEDATKIIPQLVFIDVTTMAMLLVGVTFIYERDEATIRSILVSPISKSEYILAKMIANIIPSILSLTIMYIYSKVFKIVDINYLILLGAVILVAFFHSLVGFLLTYYSKDFTDLVMAIMKIFLIFLLPVLLDEFNIVTNEIFRKLVYILPTKSALMILMGTTGTIQSWEIVVSIIYMTLGSLILYYLVWKNFKKYSLRESGE